MLGHGGEGAYPLCHGGLVRVVVAAVVEDHHGLDEVAHEEARHLAHELREEHELGQLRHPLGTQEIGKEGDTSKGREGRQPGRALGSDWSRPVGGSELSGMG